MTTIAMCFDGDAQTTVVSGSDHRSDPTVPEEEIKKMMRKLCLVLATSAIGVTGAAYAASFADIDSNADGTIDAEEFAAAYPEVDEGAWTSADANGDGMLSEEEHVAAIMDELIPSE